MAGDFNNDFNNDFTIDGVGPSGGELRLNGVLIPDMMVGSTRIAEAWLNGVKVFESSFGFIVDGNGNYTIDENGDYLIIGDG